MGPYPLDMANSMGRMMNPSMSMHAQMATPNNAPQPVPSPKISLEGIDVSTPLSKLSVEETAALLSKIEGLNSRKLASYQENIKENNITGAVLSECELPELKEVMGMTFGDWELFRKTVKALRKAEEYNRYDYVDGPVSSNNLLSPNGQMPKLDSARASPRVLTDGVNMLDQELHTPQAQRPAISCDNIAKKLSKLVKDNSTASNGSEEIELSALSDVNVPSMQTSVSSFGSRESEKSHFRDMEKPGFKYGTSKPNSELSELMQEQDMFDSVMQEMGMGSDEDSETELIAETSDNDSITMNNLEIPATKLGSSDMIAFQDPLTSPLLPAPSKEAATKKGLGTVSKLVGSVVMNLVPNPLNSGQRSKSREKLTGSGVSLQMKPDIRSSTSSAGEDEAFQTDTMPLMSPSESKEHLNFRKAVQQHDLTGKSAFKPVTPSSSRAASTHSSRSSSRERLTSPTSKQAQSNGCPGSPDKYKLSRQVVVDIEGKSQLQKSTENVSNI